MALTPDQMLENERNLRLPHWRDGKEIDLTLASATVPSQTNAIPILRGHDHNRVIGTLEDGVVTLNPEAKVTPLGMVAIFGSCGYQVLEYVMDGNKAYVRKARISHFSFDGAP